MLYFSVFLFGKMGSMEKPKFLNSTYLAPGIAGAVGGLSVKAVLYPLDTLKTRLQSENGFHKSGGFRGVYKGLAPEATTSMPVAALFFISYETVKSVTEPLVAPAYFPAVHCAAAGIAEILACLIRVPTEIAKQRKQTYVGVDKRSSISILYKAYLTEGVCRGVYRGYLSTVARNLPLGSIRISIWEWLKEQVRRRNNGEITSFQSACCAAVATVVAGAVTTPLDVAKTRIMLAENSSQRNLRLLPVLQEIYRTGGVRGLFAGGTPRMAAQVIGSFLFFGVYDEIKSFVEIRYNVRK